MAKYNTAEFRAGMKMPKPEKMPRKYGENLGEEDYMKMPRKYEGADTMLMPADKYGKTVDKVLGRSKGRMRGDYNEEPDTGMRKGGMVKKSKPKATKSRGDGCCVKGKTKGRMV